MNSAPLTMRGPSVRRGALWETSGVSKAGSAGNLEVKTFDFGRSTRDISPGGAGPLVERWEAIWFRRRRVLERMEVSGWIDGVVMYRDRLV